jgi:hypothetical protein
LSGKYFLDRIVHSQLIITKYKFLFASTFQAIEVYLQGNGLYTIYPVLLVQKTQSKKLANQVLERLKCGSERRDSRASGVFGQLRIALGEVGAGATQVRKATAKLREQGLYQHARDILATAITLLKKQRVDKALWLVLEEEFIALQSYLLAEVRRSCYISNVSPYAEFLLLFLLKKT